MSSAITKVDHAILFVRDLDTAATRYRRLGFTLTPRYTHPWGGFSNHNLMFEQDYVELLLPIEPTERNLARFRELDRSGEGLKDISLAVPDSSAAARTYAAAGLPSLPPADIERPVTRPDGIHEAKFCVVYLPVDRLLPGLNVHMIRHLTPELVWLPEYQTHANGARGLSRLVVATADPERFATPYAAMFGAVPHRGAAGDLTMPATQMTFTFVPPAQLGTLFPGVVFEAEPPFVAALEIRVAQVERARQHLVHEHVPHRTAPDGALEIPPDQACGVLVRLRQG
jgi:catechol 2,3-dioxygenase-like lactoylglutathione lyase family enzyme